MRLQRHGSRGAVVRRVDHGQTAAPIADNDDFGGWVEADVVGVGVEFDASGRRVIGATEYPQRSVTAIGDVQRLGLGNVGEAL